MKFVLSAALFAIGYDCASIVRTVPDGPLIIGYQNWGACNLTRTLSEVEHGMNVVIWFANNLVDLSGEPVVSGGPNYTCVAEVRAAIEAKGLPTTHLISVGGWDAPHPSTAFSGGEWFTAWNAWNLNLPRPFDGFDWDLEGNDNQASPNNVFTPEVLDLMVDMSVAAKTAGYIVTLVPAQSYLDPTTENFNRNLTNAYADFHPDFHYRGMNCYAYLLAASPANTFDLVTIQLYESWSRASQALQSGVPGASYLESFAHDALSGWYVNFDDPLLRVSGRVWVQIQPAQLVIGLSFGDGTGKVVYFPPEQVAASYGASLRPRGYAFWCISLDGGRVNGTQQTVDLTSGLNSFLNIRPTKIV